MTSLIQAALALVAALMATAGPGASFAPLVHEQPPPVRTPRVLEGLAARGSHIGVSIRDVEEDDAKAAKLSSQGGVVIEDITAGDPAEKAGIKKGDLVVEFDGDRIRSVRQFKRLVQETPPGRRVQASLVREGQRVNVTIEPRESDPFRLLTDEDGVSMFRTLEGFRGFLAPRPAAPATPPMARIFPDVESYAWRSGNSLGMTVSDLSSQLAEYFGTQDGVLVTSVYDQSAAAKAGVKAGDVVTALNDGNVRTPSELRQRIRGLREGAEFSVAVVRDRKPLTLKGRVESFRSRQRVRSLS
jgi:S1-C subfamily serine protease